MRARMSGRWAVLGGVTALTTSLLTSAPARAEEPLNALRKVLFPVSAIDLITADTVEDVPTVTPKEPFPTTLSQAATTTGACLGATASYGAEGCFQHNGDTTWVADTVADGMSAAVGVYTDYGRPSFACINNQGAHTWAICKKDYRETGNVRLRILRYDGDTKKFYQPESWSGWIPVDGQF